jgi:hypothetical protein
VPGELPCGLVLSSMNKETKFFGASCERLKLNQSEVDQGRPDGRRRSRSDRENWENESSACLSRDHSVSGPLFRACPWDHHVSAQAGTKMTKSRLVPKALHSIIPPKKTHTVGAIEAVQCLHRIHPIHLRQLEVPRGTVSVLYL